MVKPEAQAKVKSLIGRNKKVEEVDNIMMSLILDGDVVLIQEKENDALGLAMTLEVNDYKSKGYQPMWVAESVEEGRLMQELLKKKGMGIDFGK
jgi:hypothetical protein